MVTRIIDELGDRSDLENQIISAINTAIGAYQSKTFWFARKRGQLVIPTVANQEDYDSDDSAQIPLIVKIDWAKVLVGSTQLFDLKQISQEEMEMLLVNQSGTNIPTRFSFYDETLWFWPIPATVYSIRVAGTFMIAAPAAGSTTGNAWMTYAETLIRSRAKWEIAMHVEHDEELATRMAAAVSAAETELNRISVSKSMVNKGRVKAMEF